MATRSQECLAHLEIRCKLLLAAAQPTIDAGKFVRNAYRPVQCHTCMTCAARLFFTLEPSPSQCTHAADAPKKDKHNYHASVTQAPYALAPSWADNVHDPVDSPGHSMSAVHKQASRAGQWLQHPCVAFTHCILSKTRVHSTQLAWFSGCTCGQTRAVSQACHSVATCG